MPVLGLWIAAACFLGAAAVGLALVLAHQRGQAVPLRAAIPHGVLAGGGLAALTTAVVSAATPGAGTFSATPVAALALAVAVAAGGVTLFVMHARGRHLPRGLIYAHAGGAALVIGLLAFVLLARATGWVSEPPGAARTPVANPVVP